MYFRVLRVLALLVFFSSCSQKQSDQQKVRDIGPMELLHKEGDQAGAKSAIENYLRSHPKNEYAWSLLGNIESEMGKPVAASIAYEKALSINKNTAQALTGLGILARQRSEYSKAAGYYYEAIKVNPEYGPAYSSLVTIELKRRNLESAVAMGKKGYELNSTDPVIASNLSIAYHYIGDHENRDKFYNIARSLGYKNMETLDKIFSGELTVFD